MKREEIQIVSYFSLPTDLATTMRKWPEFVCGEGCSLDLESMDQSERVSVRFVDRADDTSYVSVQGTENGPLLVRVLGMVVYQLAAHSDNLMVNRGGSYQE